MSRATNETVLRVLERRALTTAEIAADRSVASSPSAVGRVLQRLRERGMVEQVKTDQQTYVWRVVAR